MNSVDNASVTQSSATSSHDWYSVLRPMTSCCRIIGIFPLSLRGPVSGKKYRQNWALLIYDSVIFILLISCFMLYTSEMIPSSTSMEQVVETIVITMHGLLIVVVFVTVIFTRKKMANTLNNIFAQDEALRKLGIRFDYTADFEQSRVRVGIIVSMIVMVLICDFVSLFQQNWRFPWKWLTWSLARSTRIMSTCLFAEIILILKRKFTAINESLAKMIEQTRNSPLQTTFMQIRICGRIRSIARIHGNLCEIASSLNQIFGVRIVLGIIHTLVLLTAGPYYFIQKIRIPDGNLYEIGFIARGMLGYADICYLLWTCIITQNQANLTGKLIHKLNLREVDSVVNLTINSFSLQLHHAKIKFTGAGLFPFDATLIRSIVGAVTTYLVIVLQFDTAKP